ncbi:heparin lyase I family protein [Marinirhabdus gelatinilytica]|uniref:Polysaccharide lyase-like protein n=1 Tax=Marinirhabdus gelatinilytica TaxID=1703343 RepID=A0A370QJH3_9FLAO|nr:heparin lyase I family protein [Marinirhabdus gelatinilytica]RDK88508.1 polysaccharide lyase-like protein [Marinirhabdus gelatinilytica]
MKIIYVFLVPLVLFSCKQNENRDIVISNHGEKREYNDKFQDSFNSFWYTHQVASPDRLQFVKDPSDDSNDLLKVSLTKTDTVAKGFRSEIIIKPKDSFGYLNKHSFKFKFPKSFFEKEEKKGVILLNQWHNVPYPGYNYRNQIVKVRVPFAMMVEHTPNGDFYMKLHYGLNVGTLNEMEYAIWPGELKPDVWYTFENEIFWSLYEDGYSKPKIDGICFESGDEEVCSFEGANMYHILPHDYKMGLYWSPGHVHDRHIYYDDFKMTTERVGYFPPVIETDSIRFKKK